MSDRVQKALDAALIVVWVLVIVGGTFFVGYQRGKREALASCHVVAADASVTWICGNCTPTSPQVIP